MSKRFTEAEKWRDAWFRKLSAEAKLLWLYLLDCCDAAGVVEPDLELASFQIGLEVGAETMAELEGRVEHLDGSKYWIPRFISFQVGTPSTECRAHNPIFQSIKKHKLERVLDTIQTVSNKGQDKDKDKDKDKDSGVESAERRGGVTYSDDFIRFWRAYPNRTGKGDAWRAWQRINPRPLMDDMVAAVLRDAQRDEWRKDRGKFIPHPSTWLNGRRWEDEGLLLTQPGERKF
jgi:hypothetical protein